MSEMIKMVVVLTFLSSLSGGLLAALDKETKPKIEVNILKFEKAPAIKKIFKGATNDPVADRFTLTEGEETLTFFVGVFDGKASAVAFDSTGKGGYGGDVGLMLGVDVETDKIVGIGVTTHSETPGLGSMAKTDPEFAGQFKELAITDDVKVKKDGGQVDALSGATLTSRAVCAGVNSGSDIYQRLKPKISEKLKEFK
jgi:electron transport complex protein RnfG